MDYRIKIGLHRDENSLEVEALGADGTKTYGNFAITDTVINANSGSKYRGQTTKARTTDMFKRLEASGHITLDELNKVFDGEVLTLQLPGDLVRFEEELDERNPGQSQTKVSWLGGYEVAGHKATKTSFRFE